MRSARWRALGTDVHLLVTDDAALPAAVALLHEDLAALDTACSRFRPDSELRRLRPGAQQVSPLLAAAVTAALEAAEQTDGLVDPTLGHDLVRAGYDRSFELLAADGPAAVPGRRRSRWREVQVAGLEVSLPPGVLLDLGATAKAWAADRAAERISRLLATGVLVNLGGDLAVGGPPPEGGWVVDAMGDVVAVTGGGLATSSTTERTWRRGGRSLHHVLDPRTGTSATPRWASVTVAAGTCLAANTASTAAIVLADAAPDWLRLRGLPARLTTRGAAALSVAEWPVAAA